MTEQCDILISGGGVAGLTAAVTFGAAGFDVICADPTPPVTEQASEGADLRTTAFLQPARALLDEVGLWPQLAPHAMPLEVMRIVDASHGPARIVRDFRAEELSDQPFGWNLPNWLLRREMLGRLGEMDNVRFLSGTGTQRLLTRDTGARVWLSDGTPVSA
ncbi:MAG: FAD-binding protein, partial [Paracoccaceae bacterium]